MHLRQAILLDLQPHPPGRIAIDQVDEVPRNHHGPQPAGDRIDRARGQPLQQPPHRAANPYLDLRDAQGQFELFFRPS